MTGPGGLQANGRGHYLRNFPTSGAVSLSGAAIPVDYGCLRHTCEKRVDIGTTDWQLPTCSIESNSHR